MKMLRERVDCVWRNPARAGAKGTGGASRHNIKKTCLSDFRRFDCKEQKEVIALEVLIVVAQGSGWRGTTSLFFEMF